jgi:hypothetical protein
MRYLDLKINSNLNSSPPIDIDGDVAFTNQANINEWQGSGIVDDPFIIEHLIIESPNDTAVRIRNTEVHFIIRENSFTNSAFGLLFDNVKNAVVINNTAEFNEVGFSMRLSRAILFENNFAINNTISGFDISRAQDTFINNNIALNNRNGFKVSSTIEIVKNLVLSKNFAEFNQENGFSIIGSTAVIVENNYSYNNSLSGFRMDTAQDLIIRENIALNNREGYSITSSVELVIERNIGELNLLNGFRLSRLENSVIKENHAQLNGLHGFYINQVTDSEIENNTSSGNNGFGYFFIRSTSNLFNNNTWSNNSGSFIGAIIKILLFLFYSITIYKIIRYFRLNKDGWSHLIKDRSLSQIILFTTSYIIPLIILVYLYSFHHPNNFTINSKGIETFIIILMVIFGISLIRAFNINSSIQVPISITTRVLMPIILLMIVIFLNDSDILRISNFPLGGLSNHIYIFLTFILFTFFVRKIVESYGQGTFFES